MSYEKLIIDTDDKSNYESLVDGSPIASTVHGHRATSRFTLVSDDIEPSDENNFIEVSGDRTSDVTLSKTNIEGLSRAQFKVIVYYNASYVAYVSYNGTQFWILNGTTDSPVTYVFSVGPGPGYYLIPERDDLTLTSPV
jgi:hypothetical protein